MTARICPNMPLLATLWEVVWRSARALEASAPQQQTYDVCRDEKDDTPEDALGQGASLEAAIQLLGKRRHALRYAGSDEGKDGDGKQRRAGRHATADGGDGDCCRLAAPTPARQVCCRLQTSVCDIFNTTACSCVTHSPSVPSSHKVPRKSCTLSPKGRLVLRDIQHPLPLPQAAAAAAAEAAGSQ